VQHHLDKHTGISLRRPPVTRRCKRFPPLQPSKPTSNA